MELKNNLYKNNLILLNQYRNTTMLNAAPLVTDTLEEVVTNNVSQHPPVHLTLVSKLQSNQEEIVSITIDEMIKDRKHWQESELKVSNESLYSILTRCYQLFKDMKNGTCEAKVLLNAFHRKYPNKALGVKDSVHLMNKIIFIVFGDINSRRISKYASALRIAADKGATPKGLADFLVKEGGVEEVTRSKKHPKYTRPELGRSALYGTPIMIINDADLLHKFNYNNCDHGVLFLATYDVKTKSFPIHRVIQNTTAIKAAYTSLSSSISSNEKKAMIADLYESEEE